MKSRNSFARFEDMLGSFADEIRNFFVCIKFFCYSWIVLHSLFYCSNSSKFKKNLIFKHQPYFSLKNIMLVQFKTVSFARFLMVARIIAANYHTNKVSLIQTLRSHILKRTFYCHLQVKLCCYISDINKSNVHNIFFCTDFFKF